MTKICIITARGGSKRIPRKNIKNFCGKPIIAYSIEAAMTSQIFNTVMVSTDDEEIAQIAKQYGAAVPFLRSQENSDGYASTADVIIEVINEYQNLGIIFDNICCLYPTAPFVTSSNLREGHEMLYKNNFDSVFSVCTFSSPILRALKISSSKKIDMIWEENINKRSQDLQPTYYDAGQFYWLNTNSFLKDKKLFTNNSGGFIRPEMEVQDIDNYSDWKLAEIKFKILNNIS